MESTEIQRNSSVNLFGYHGIVKKGLPLLAETEWPKTRDGNESKARPTWRVMVTKRLHELGSLPVTTVIL